MLVHPLGGMGAGSTDPGPFYLVCLSTGRSTEQVRSVLNVAVWVASPTPANTLLSQLPSSLIGHRGASSLRCYDTWISTGCG